MTCCISPFNDWILLSVMAAITLLCITSHVEQVCPSVTQPAPFVLPLQVITLQNASSAAEPIRLVQRAPGFRLFATQNPNAGWFKGRREPLSHALINRFVPVVFQQLPAEEWEQVVAAQLTAGGMVAGPAAALAAQLVSFHTAIQTACCSKSFPEVCANSSNRFMTVNGIPQQHNQLSCCIMRCKVCYLLPVTCHLCHLCVEGGISLHSRPSSCKHYPLTSGP